MARPPVALRVGMRLFGAAAPGAAAAWLGRRLMTPARVRPLTLDPPAAPGVSRHIPFSGGHLAVTEWGSGPAVLLLHGWGSDSSSYWRVVDPLVDRGLRPVAFDFPAHGKSDGKRTNMIECADALLRVSETSGPVRGAIAHSFGSPTAALAATQGLELERLVMVAPPRSVHASLRETALSVGIPKKVFARTAADFEERLGFRWDEIDTDRLVARLRASLLVVHDERDRVLPWTHGAAVASAAPDARLLTTSGLGHRSALVDEGVVSDMVSFVAEHRSAPGGEPVSVTAGAPSAIEFSVRPAARLDEVP